MAFELNIFSSFLLDRIFICKRTNKFVRVEVISHIRAYIAIRLNRKIMNKLNALFRAIQSER